MKTVLSLLITVVTLAQLNAADLLVEEFGLSPAYSTIGDAVAAASDGDRIIIKNRTGGIPWVENVTINKSLEILSYDNDDFFIVQGTWFLVPSSGRTITIIGMQNTNGGISASTNGSGTRTVMNIFDTHLINGSLNFNYNYLDVNIVGTKLDNGSINIKYGSVVGCDVTYGSAGGAINITSDASPSDAILNIVGNRIDHNYASTSIYGAIDWNSSSQFFNIRNNYIQASNMGIYLDDAKSSTVELQVIYNNSIQIVNGSSSTSATRCGIYVESIGTSSNIEVMNNLIDMTATYTGPYNVGIYSATNSGQRNVYYNMVDDNTTMDASINNNWTVNTNNNTSTTVSMNSTTGASSQGANLGNPATPFYDIDLTRNDMGCFGGSFTADNFFPMFTGAARVWFVAYPFNIRQGNTLSIQGATYDR